MAPTSAHRKLIRNQKKNLCKKVEGAFDTLWYRCRLRTPRSYAKLAIKDNDIKEASSPPSPACNVLKKKTLEEKG